MVVGKVVECGSMFRDEHEASIDGADEVAGWVRPALSWISPQRSSVAVSKER